MRMCSLPSAFRRSLFHWRNIASNHLIYDQRDSALILFLGMTFPLHADGILLRHLLFHRVLCFSSPFTANTIHSNIVQTLIEVALIFYSYQPPSFIFNFFFLLRLWSFGFVFFLS
ncbi:hypothetical protein CPB83DRAFT_856204 [Crepidotus variabilis]|uniref:Uncharacterized protein n=1 Tax=Crepidotus variabilis TaxID=179855 RepID=A0A9P6EEE9_9AGAR|nr:hypothetical protein CPB83DRAFT_856204 [Crepidotus variabilis]